MLNSRLSSRIVVSVFLLVSSSLALHAADPKLYFTKPDSVNTIALLPAPPLKGSLEEQADMAAVVHARNTCSSNDLVIAKQFDRKQGPFNMASFVGEYFKEDKLPKTAALFRHAQHDTAYFVDIGKKHWKRLRPSVVDTNLLVVSLDTGLSYPSGHSAGGTIVMLILMDLFPEHADAIQKVGYDTGWHRVQLAKHYPTDIQAGRVLALAAYNAMKSNPRFQQELAEAKAELMEAQKAASATEHDSHTHPETEKAGVHAH